MNFRVEQLLRYVGDGNSEGRKKVVRGQFGVRGVLLQTSQNTSWERHREELYCEGWVWVIQLSIRCDSGRETFLHCPFDLPLWFYPFPTHSISLPIPDAFRDEIPTWLTHTIHRNCVWERKSKDRHFTGWREKIVMERSCIYSLPE